jgi:hypothetical protein
LHALLLLSVLAGGSQPTIYLGFVASKGFGERPGPSIAVSLRQRAVRSYATIELAPKIESGRGYLAAADLDVGRTLFLGMGLHHRDGGNWTKSSAWARAGLQGHNTRLVLRHDLTSINRVSIAEGILEAGGNRLRVRGSLGVGTYTASSGGRREWGAFSGLQVGLRP